MFYWAARLNTPLKISSNATIAVEHKVYAFEAVCDGEIALIDVHVFNTVSLCWKKLTPVTTIGTGEPPLEWYGYTAVLVGDIIYIWGGQIPYRNELYAFDVDTHIWFKTKVSGTVPEERTCHSACVLGKAMYIHGGRTQTGHTNNISKLDTTTMVWSLINTRGTPPPVSSVHSATIIGTKMFVFGGCGEQQHIRVFDTETNCWLSTPSAQLLPEACWKHSAFAYKGELYICVGSSFGKNFFDPWKFNPDTCSWKKVEPKGKDLSQMHWMGCCMVGDRVILFGSWMINPDDLLIIELNPSLKTLCKLAVIQYGLEQSELPHNVRWELAVMTTNSNREKNYPLVPAFAW